MNSWFILLLAYLLGSIPFGLLITKAAGLGDIRNIGSGNIGATNVMRTGNKKLGILTLLLDAGKGATAVLMLPPLSAEETIGYLVLILLVLYAVILGHIFPVWLKFRGGKGVATALGAVTAYYWPLGIAFSIVWLVIFYGTKYVSIASIVATGAMVLFSVFLFHKLEAIGLFLPLFFLIVYTHRGNIKRLLAGTEPKFGKKAS